MRAFQMIILVLLVCSVSACVLDQTHGYPDTCWVHHSHMMPILLPIESGRTTSFPLVIAATEASVHAFPNAPVGYDNYYPRSLTAPRRVRLYECPECRRARCEFEADWDFHHGPNHGLE